MENDSNTTGDTPPISLKRQPNALQSGPIVPKSRSDKRETICDTIKKKRKADGAWGASGQPPHKKFAPFSIAETRSSQTRDEKQTAKRQAETDAWLAEQESNDELAQDEKDDLAQKKIQLLTSQTFNTTPVSHKDFMDNVFAKIQSNVAEPCFQELRTSSQTVVVRCPKGVGVALEAKLNQYVLTNEKTFKGTFRVNPASERFPDFFSNFKSADGQHDITQLDLKCGKSFDLSRLELLFKNISEPGGVYKKLFQTMYIITLYSFDENTGRVKPEPPVLKYIHELTARSRTKMNQTFEMMSIGGASVNLRPTGCTIKTYKDIGADRTRAGFIEIILETLFSEHPRCQQIRNKISKKIEDCRWKWHASIVRQVLELQRRGLFVRTIRDSFETNGIVHNTGFNHNK
jgi:hypothetical protein